MKVSSIKRGLYFYLARSSVYQRTIAADNAAAVRFSVGKRFEEEKGKKRWKFDFPPPEIGEKFFSSLFAGNYSLPRFDVAYLRFLPPELNPLSPPDLFYHSPNFREIRARTWPVNYHLANIFSSVERKATWKNGKKERKRKVEEKFRR